MKVLSAQEIKNLDLPGLQEIAITYAGLLAQAGSRLDSLEKGYQLLLGKLEQDQQQMLFAKQVIANLQHDRFGQSSERRPSGNGVPSPAAKKKREQWGPTEQPRLPIQEVMHDLRESERVCDACGEPLTEWAGQFEESERIQVVPVRFVLEKHQRKKYRCSCGSCIKTAPGPLRLKEGGRYSPEFGVEVGLGKYEHHVPLERQVKIMKQQGLLVESQTLFAQTDTIAWYLKKPVYEKIAERVRSSAFASADETPWENLGKDAKKQFYLWGARSKDAVFFQIADSRSSSAAEVLLKGFTGALMCDGFRGYNPIASDEVILAHCWSHARRKFISAELAYPSEAQTMIALIGSLYEIERELKEEGASLERIQAVREERSKVVLEKIYEKLWELKTHLPKSSLGKAVEYTLKLWRGLNVFTTYPQVPLDNNAMEREIRGPVTGRKNHMGSKNLKTAEVASVWYSVIATCKTCGVDPKEYVNETLRAILEKREILLPWEWPTGRRASEIVSKTAVFETPEPLISEAL